MRDITYMIEVMTAARDGKKIEFSNSGVISLTGGNTLTPYWETMKWQCWDWSHYDYRIAPEPRKAREWDALIADTSLPNANTRWIRLREVLPEDAK